MKAHPLAFLRRRSSRISSVSVVSKGEEEEQELSVPSSSKRSGKKQTSTTSSGTRKQRASRLLSLGRRKSNEESATTSTTNYKGDDEELPGCLICLDPMNQADLAHPLMCTSHGCCYNFCVNCIESLMEQKQATTTCHSTTVDEYEDVPRPKNEDIILHCPNCRSDLGPTVCDTILLRKVDHVPSENDDEEAIRKRLTLKKAIDVDVTLLREIALARDREAFFLEQKFRKEQQSESIRSLCEERQDIEDFVDDEWGFEVDIHLGAHESIKLPKDWFPFSVYQTNEAKTDRTLLGGLESILPLEEQKEITRCMTSGDTSELAKAAEILSSVAELVHLQWSGSNVGTTSGGKTTSFRSKQRRPSIYNLIETGKRARSDIHRKQPVPTSGLPSKVAPIYTKSYTIKATKHRQIERQLREKLAYLRLYPLPVRMPKYAEFTIQLDGLPNELELSQIVKSLPVRFCNDTWNGTVIDAFHKIYVSPKDLKTPQNGKNYAKRSLPTSTFVDNYSVSHKRQDTPGIRNILKSDSDVRIDTPHPRVLIAAVVDSQAGLQGVLKGDVVTHLNGVELMRDNCQVDDVMALICSLLFSSSEVVRDGNGGGVSTPKTTLTLKLVLNADRATAKALKMRAVAPYC